MPMQTLGGPGVVHRNNSTGPGQYPICADIPPPYVVFLKMAGILMVYFAPEAQPITSSVSSPPVERSR